MTAEYPLIEHHVSLINDWLGRCSHRHGNTCEAVPIAERSPWQIPEWVIDTEQYCIVPGASTPKYAALSYTWSSPSDEDNQTAMERLMLRQGNLEQFTQPDYLFSDGHGALPTVIQDAMNLVRQSGVRYLWVDCLCIVQDAETTKSEVGFMTEIYSGAYFTIIAAADSPRLCGQHSGRDTPGEFRDAIDFHNALLESHWATRGWTFQEHLLSKRRVVFLDAVTFWDCQHDMWWPGLSATTGGRKHRKTLEMRVRKLSRELASVSGLKLDLYKELVCRYNHRDLTYPQDALRAFSGVLNAFIRDFPDGFVGGLPVRFLGHSLSWQPFRMARKRVEVLSGCAQSAPLPSWSWAGWQCLVDPTSLHSRSHCEIEIHTDQLPPASVESLANKSSGVINAALLPCTTTTARFRVRRVLFCQEKASSGGGALYGSAPYVEETDLYKHPPEVKSCCPVITLEDGQGRWAGLLRVMDENFGVEAGQTIQAMALSQDHSTYWEAAATYEAMVDSFGCYRVDTSHQHYHFASSTCSQRPQKRQFGHNSVPCSLVRTENITSGLDQGPFFYYDDKEHAEGLSSCTNSLIAPAPPQWNDQVYAFYNVLWVENRDGVMYRKAAGRISKEVWEQNCGARERLLLG